MKAKKTKAAKKAEAKRAETKKPEPKTTDTKAAEIVKVSGQLSRPEAEKLNTEIKDGFKAWQRNVIETAVALEKFIRGRGWLALNYENMTAWREKEIGEGDFYYLRNMQRLLAEGVPAESVEKMRITNINTMARTLTPKQWKDDKWQKAAAEMPTDEFTAKAHQVSDELGQHVEMMEHRGFSVSRSIAKSWDLAVKIAQLIDGADSMERRIEAIASNYLNSPSEVEGKNKLQAYQAAYESEEIAAIV